MSRPEGPRLLVVGAAPRSLGDHVAREAELGPYSFDAIYTAGITPTPHDGDPPEGKVAYEDYYLDLRHVNSIKEVLGEVKPDIIVCTVGVNNPTSVLDSFADLALEDSFHVNVIGVLALLRHFVKAEGSGYWNGSTNKKFVAISSNSARIPRRRSLAYCASKAALSMALRVAARELADEGVVVWGYEPGLLAGTPMTADTEGLFAGGPLHRMPGVPESGLLPAALAQMILHDVANVSPAFNGLLIPFDAGEL